MVAYKKSTSAMILSAAVAAAQNGTIPYPVETEITYTTVIEKLCTSGLVPQTYTIKQHCDYLPCEQPAVPYGWEVTTKWCEHGCGPAPTYVPVTECPWENPAPTPACYGAGCYQDEVICPEGNTYTNWYLMPTPAPQPQPPKEEYPTEYPPTEYPPTEYPPTEYPPTHEGQEYPPPKYEQPTPYPPKHEQPYPPKHEQPTPYPPKTVPYPPPVHSSPAPYPPKNVPYPPAVHSSPMPYPSAKPMPSPYTPPACEGPHCPSVYPEVVTKVYPPTKPEVPCNTTTPYPPMYTGGAVKTAASGILGFAVVALAAFL